MKNLDQKFYEFLVYTLHLSFFDLITLIIHAQSKNYKAMHCVITSIRLCLCTLLWHKEGV